MPKHVKELLISYGAYVGGQFWLAKLISRQFGLSYRDAYRITSIGSWGSYLLARSAAGGVRDFHKADANLQLLVKEHEVSQEASNVRPIRPR